MLAWCGVALSFKAQAAFLAPFVFAMLIHRRVPLRLWLIPPALCVLAGSFLVRDRLTGRQAAMIRQGAALVVYVSSAADIVLTGVAAAPWTEMYRRIAPGRTGHRSRLGAGDRIRDESSQPS